MKLYKPTSMAAIQQKKGKKGVNTNEKVISTLAGLHMAVDRQNYKTKTPVFVKVNMICRADQNWKKIKIKNVNQQTSCPTSLEDAFTMRHLRWPNVGPHRSCSSGAENYKSSLSTCSTFSSVAPAVSAAVSFIWAIISAVRASSRRLLTLRTRSSCFLKDKHKEEKKNMSRWPWSSPSFLV